MNYADYYSGGMGSLYRQPQKLNLPAYGLYGMNANQDFPGSTPQQELMRRAGMGLRGLSGMSYGGVPRPDQTGRPQYGFEPWMRQYTPQQPQYGRPLVDGKPANYVRQLQGPQPPLPPYGFNYHAPVMNYGY